MFFTLCKEHDALVILPSNFEENQAAVTAYRNDLSALEEEFKMHDYRLGEGVDKMLQLSAKWPFVVNVDIKTLVKNSLCQAALGAHTMHPKFKGNRIQEMDASLYYKMIRGFLDYALPTPMDQYYSYKNTSDIFRGLSDHEDDPLRYWGIVYRDFPEFADFGLQMNSLPALMPQVNKENLRKIFAKWIHKPALLTYAVSVTANDRV